MVANVTRYVEDETQCEQIFGKGKNQGNVDVVNCADGDLVGNGTGTISVVCSDVMLGGRGIFMLEKVILL